MEKVQVYIDRSLFYSDLIEKVGFESLTELMQAILLFHEFYRIPHESKKSSGFIEVGLIGFDSSLNSHEALKEIEVYGTPLNLFELMTLSLRYPDLSIQFSIVGLGTTLFSHTPFIRSYQDKSKTRRYLIPKRLDVPWIETFRFAVNYTPL